MIIFLQQVCVFYTIELIVEQQNWFWVKYGWWLQKLYEEGVQAGMVWNMVKAIMPGGGSRHDGNVLILLAAARGSNPFHVELNVSPVAFTQEERIPLR